MTKNKIQAHFALFGANLIYGINYTVAKDVMPDYIGPTGFVLIRVTGALLLFWLSALIIKQEKIERNDFGRILLCGLFGVALNQMLFFEGLNLTTPINAGIIMVTTPILVLIIASILVKEKVTTNKIIGIVAGISGAWLLITGSGEGNFKGNTLGDAMVFFNAASYAVYLAMVKKLMRKYQALTVIKWVFLAGLFFILPFGFNQALEVQWTNFPLEIWAAVVFVVLGTTFLAYLLNTFALKYVTPTVTAVYIYLQPVLAAIIAIWAGKDELNVLKIISAILIFAGVYLVSKSGRRTSLEEG